jgi:hypothetical protein
MRYVFLPSWQVFRCPNPPPLPHQYQHLSQQTLPFLRGCLHDLPGFDLLPGGKRQSGWLAQLPGVPELNSPGSGLVRAEPVGTLWLESIGGAV